MITEHKVKEILSKILPNSRKLQFLSYLPKLESWRKKHKEQYPVFESRFLLYDYINTEILQNKKIDYIEFGVFEGESIRYWSSVNTNKQSKFFGFDTFTGLPENWGLFAKTMSKNHFDTGGQIPEIADKRVKFIKGLFQHTLHHFLNSESLKSQLVIHNDADLYSATLYTLTKCNDIIIPGTIILFDEFSTVLDEFRALDDYSSAYLREYEILGATKSSDSYYAQTAIRIIK